MVSHATLFLESTSSPLQVFTGAYEADEASLVIQTGSSHRQIIHTNRIIIVTMVHVRNNTRGDSVRHGGYKCH